MVTEEQLKAFKKIAQKIRFRERMKCIKIIEAELEDFRLHSFQFDKNDLANNPKDYPDYDTYKIAIGNCVKALLIGTDLELELSDDD